MFYVIFRNDSGCGDYVFFGGYPTLQEASKHRKVCGDLIVDESGQVVKDESWLFPFEKKDPGCYVRQMMERTLVHGVCIGTPEACHASRDARQHRPQTEFYSDFVIIRPVAKLKRRYLNIMGRVEGGL